jgi:hypothetical protein
MDTDFVSRVVIGCFDPILVHDIDNCKWDAVSRIITTPQDEENEKLAAMESAAWYKDAFGDNVFDMSKKEKPKKLSAREMEDLHAEHSVKTAGKQPGRYEGSPGAQTFVVGQKKGKASAEGNAQASVDLFTREELLELLRKTKITPQGKGSQPRANRAGDGNNDVDDDSLISESSSSSAGSSASSSSFSSAEDKSSVPPPAPGE